MRLSMAQMHMEEDIRRNLDTSLLMMRKAKEANADLVFFPEIQLSPFFPMYPGRDASRWALSLESPEVKTIRAACKELALWASPNIYLELGGKRYDASLMIDSRGEIQGISKMVHIYQAENFYERDYYTPSDDGFKVYNTPFGIIGIVICFDRHIPGSIRGSARKGAELVLVPTANLVSEPMELFEWEARVEAFQDTAFIAMCNRVGPEGGSAFAGESLVAAPDGSLIYKAGGAEELIVVDIPLEDVLKERQRRNWLSFD